MPAYQLILRNTAKPDVRRVDFEAESVDQAFQFARNRAEDVEVELWEGAFCHVRMTNGGSHLWELHGESERQPDGGRGPDFPPMMHGLDRHDG